MTSSLVGRDRPLGVLQDAVERAVAGRGGLTLVAGEAGIGKTTLLAASAQHARVAGAIVLGGSAWEGDGVPGLWPWAQVARALERSVPASEWARCCEAAGPGIERLLGVAPGDDGPAGDASFAVLDAVATLLIEASRVHALLIVLDDLHWADVATVRVLAFLVRQVTFEAVAIFAAYRDVEVDAVDHPLRDVVHDLAASATTVRVSGLDRDAIGAIIEREVGAVDDASIDEMYRRTGGNPFFAQQTAQLWSATGSAHAMPAGVRDAIDRRLARLPTSCVEVLATAALVGTVFELAIVGNACGLEPRAVRDAVDDAERAGLVVTIDTSCARFVHDLVREALVASSADEAPARHVGILRALTNATVREPEAFAARVAHHAYAARGELDDDEVQHALRRAAGAATSRGAVEEAAMQLSRALECTPEEDDVRVPVMLELGAAQQRAGLLDEARATYLAVAEKARVAASAEWLARAALGIHGLGLVLTDDVAADVALLVEADAVVADDPMLARSALGAKLIAALSRARSHLLGEDREESERLSEVAVARARECNDDEALAFCLLARHDAIWNAGNADERRALADEMTAASHRLHDPEIELQASVLRMTALLEEGDPRGLEEHRRFVTLAERARLPRFRYFARSREATIATLVGDFLAARAFADDAKALAERIGEVDAYGAWVDQRWAIARMQRRLDEVDAIIAEIRTPGDPHVAMLECVAAIDRGDVNLARTLRPEIEELGARWPRWAALMWATSRAELAVAMGDEAERAAVRRDLESLRAYWAVLGGAVVINGPLAYWAAALDRALGRTDDAIAGFEDARRAAERLGARPWSAVAMVALAGALVDRSFGDDVSRASDLLDEVEQSATLMDMQGALDDAAVVRKRISEASTVPVVATEPAEFRREGDVWTLTFGGRTARLADAKGLRDLQTLLAHAGEEVTAIALLDPSRDAEAATAGRRLGSDLVIDDRARVEYRARLERLDEDIADALARHADDRAVELETERDALVDELRRATGLGGRSRRLGDEYERARKTVSARIRDTLRRLDEQHPELAAHLRARVTTGNSCRYDRDPVITWQF
jgi:hypothetical protein